MRLEEEADRPDRCADDVERGQVVGCRRFLGGAQGLGDDPHDCALEQEDAEVALPPEVVGVILAPLLVAEVLALAPVAPEEVAGEAQSPEEDERGDEYAALAPAIEGGMVERAEEHEADPPADVDDTGIAEDEAEEPDGGNVREGDGGGEGEDFGGGHRSTIQRPCLVASAGPAPRVKV